MQIDQEHNQAITDLKRQWVFLSYGAAMALTVAISFILYVLFAAIGETMALGGFIAIYGRAFVGGSLVLILTSGSVVGQAFDQLLKGEKVLFTSFRFSVALNSISGIVFIAIALFDNTLQNQWLIAFLPLVAFLISTLITTFTIGQLACSGISKTIKGINTD
jgi:hypothetical protein